MLWFSKALAKAGNNRLGRIGASIESVFGGFAHAASCRPLRLELGIPRSNDILPSNEAHFRMNRPSTTPVCNCRTARIYPWFFRRKAANLMRALGLGCICVGVAVGGIACRTTTVEEYQAPVPSTPGIPEDPHRS
jgi:hypothetical protein